MPLGKSILKGSISLKFQQLAALLGLYQQQKHAEGYSAPRNPPTMSGPIVGRPQRVARELLP